MKYLKILGLAAFGIMALMAFGAGSASATTLEVTGVTKNEGVTITASLESGTSLLLQTTSGGFANTCKESHIHGGTVAPFSAASSGAIGGPISVMSFTVCTKSPVTVDVKGSLSIEWISGTTNATVRSSGARVTVPSPVWPSPLSCETGVGTDIGTLTGKTGSVESDKYATMDIHAVLNCGFPAPSATWEGSYLITDPHGLGIEK
jgi:hypothetical protein